MRLPELKFNRPMVVGKERNYVEEAIQSTWISGDGQFSKRVQQCMRQQFDQEVLPTTSCTDALEMAALLAEVGPGDEVLVPSFTFVSSALAFAMRGCTIAFADSHPDFPHIGWDQIEPRLTAHTKVVVVVDYGGAGHDLFRIEQECQNRGIVMVEDAAQGVGVQFGKGDSARWLGSFGDAGTYSFHETKNVHCGEGGALVLNRDSWRARASVLWEKGTNRKAFFEGLVDKYGWVDLGSSFLPNELSMAYLMGQLARCAWIKEERVSRWEAYQEAFAPLEEKGLLKRQVQPPGGGHNGHLFYILLPDLGVRSRLIAQLKAQGIHTAFHYQSLHASRFMEHHQPGSFPPCPEADRFSNTLLRMPLHLAMNEDDVERVATAVHRAL